MSRWASPAVAVALAALLVVGGASAVASRMTRGPAPRAAPQPVPAEGVGSSAVELSADAGYHPDADAVRAQLQRHYNAINARDYAEWRETVVPERSNVLPEQVWRDSYTSTRDGTIRVDRIDPAGGGLLVRVRFVSTQTVEDAPPDLPETRICWRSTLPMRGVPPLIDITRGGSSSAEACP